MQWEPEPVRLNITDKSTLVYPGAHNGTARAYAAPKLLSMNSNQTAN
jgi:hypothetical protein